MCDLTTLGHGDRVYGLGGGASFLKLAALPVVHLMAAVHQQAAVPCCKLTTGSFVGEIEALTNEGLHGALDYITLRPVHLNLLIQFTLIWGITTVPKLLCITCLFIVHREAASVGGVMFPYIACSLNAQSATETLVIPNKDCHIWHLTT